MEETMKLGSQRLVESIKEDPQMVGSLSTEWTDEKHNLYLKWTDEKHNLYLNSIEASFVNQLYNQDNRLRDLHVWSSRRQKLLAPNSSQSNSNEYFSSNQHGKLVSDIVHFGGQKYRRGVFGLGTISSKLSPCYSVICRQDSVGSNAEVSDQNFVEEDFESTPLSRSRKKRPRAAVADVSSNDQVVPLVKSPVTESANEIYYQKEDEHFSDQQPENMTNSPLPKFGLPSAEER